MNRVWLNIWGGISFWLIAVATWLFGSLDALFWGAVFMAVIDLITGVIGALKSGEFDSKVFKTGLLKKIGCLIAVTAVYRLDVIAPSLSKVVPAFAGWEEPFRDICLGSFLFNDFMSIFENLGKWGVQLPDFLTNRLARLKSEKMANSTKKS